MKFTYVIINTLVLAGVAFIVWRGGGLSRSRFIKTVAVLFVLTAVFDNLIIAARLCGYDLTRTLGLTIGIAPVEDFYYSLVAVMLMGWLWERGRPRD